ncbi:MAG: hypothetical protein E7204_02220 [Veillonella sp.]|uniref:restriction endonuclease subunit S n=1 Tax=Veillonella sp. TaxID=1926307 RepID=UPI0025E92CFD|nr:restriction endonuclease subunit S [Veillonella sp.]MBE6079652.1 hypothetical protein [Veillonella sp.]
MNFNTEKLKNIAIIRTGKLDSNAAVENGEYPFFTCDPKTLSIDKWAYDTEAVLLAGNNASGNYTAKYFHGRFNAYQRTYIIESQDVEKLNVRFLGYAINQQLRLLKTMSAGTSTKFLTIKILHGLNIPFPSIEVQNKISGILATYDNLIENNQKQIKLLEEAAQRLYKEWFVNLRFPGYEDVKVIDGIPEGWSKSVIRDCLERYIGGGWGKEVELGKNYIPGKVIRGTDINDIKQGTFDDLPLRYYTENDKQKRVLRAYDIVFEVSNGNINNIGRNLLIDEFILKQCGNNTICASFCKLLRPNDHLHAILLFLEIQRMQKDGTMAKYKKQGSNGINNFAFEKFLEHELLIPDNLSNLYHLDKVISQIGILRSQIGILKQSRDCLLPKLMSGEIEV